MSDRVMERKQICLLGFIAFLVVITLIFSGCVSGGGYSITYYAPYDSDGLAESNPVYENPLPYPFSINNASIVPVYIGVLVKKDQQPLAGENVTLDIWNENSIQSYRTQTNSGGYAVFFIAINDAPENNATLFNYHAYLNRQENITTPIRFIVVNTTIPGSENDGKTIRQVRKEWIQSGEPQNTSILRLVYSVVTRQDLRDTYHFSARDSEGQLIFEKHGPFQSKGNQDQQISFDIPVQNLNRFQKLNVNFTLEDPSSFDEDIVIPARGFNDFSDFKMPKGPSNPQGPSDIPKGPSNPQGPSDIPKGPPDPQGPEPVKPDPFQKPPPNTEPYQPDIKPYQPDIKPWIPPSDPKPGDNSPPAIPEGDNLIVVGILTMMLVVYIVIQRRDR